MNKSMRHWACGIRWNASPRGGRIHESPNASPPHFVAERLRVPTGGCGGLRAPLPSAREAAPLRKGECIVAHGPNPRIPERIASAFCSGTPPRSEGGGRRAAGPTPVGAGSRAATKRRMHRRAEAESTNASPPHFVAERLRVPRGGRWAAGPTPVGAGSRAATKRRTHRRAEAESTNASPPHFVAERLRVPRGGGQLRAPLPSAREAAPLQKGECIAARRPNPRMHRRRIL